VIKELNVSSLRKMWNKNIKRNALYSKMPGLDFMITFTNITTKDTTALKES